MKIRIQIGISGTVRTVSFILLTLLLASCGNSSQAGIPPGTYTATFTASDNIQVGDSLMTGSSSIIFTETGDFTIVAPQATITGRYTVNGDQITFDEGTTGTFPCIEEPTYVYSWNLQNDELTFINVEDSCDPRILAMTAKPYVMEK